MSEQLHPFAYLDRVDAAFKMTFDLVIDLGSNPRTEGDGAKVFAAWGIFRDLRAGMTHPPRELQIVTYFVEKVSEELSRYPHARGYFSSRNPPPGRSRESMFPYPRSARLNSIKRLLQVLSAGESQVVRTRERLEQIVGSLNDFGLSPPVLPSTLLPLALRSGISKKAAKPNRTAPAGGRKKSKATANARMLETMEKDPNCKGWTTKQWAARLKCAQSTVVATRAWKKLAMLRDEGKARRAMDRRRRLQKKHS